MLFRALCPLHLTLFVRRHFWQKIKRGDNHRCRFHTGWSSATVILISFWKELKKEMAKPNNFCWAFLWIFWCLSMVRSKKSCLSGMCQYSVIALYREDREPSFLCLLLSFLSFFSLQLQSIVFTQDRYDYWLMTHFIIWNLQTIPCHCQSILWH